MFDQLLGDRVLNQTCAIEFPSIEVLRSAIQSPAFTDLMNNLAVASDDHMWVLGEEEELPFTLNGSYFDPALQNLDEQAALDLLASRLGSDASDSKSKSQSDPAVLVDMVVSDAPSPLRRKSR